MVDAVHWRRATRRRSGIYRSMTVVALVNLAVMAGAPRFQVLGQTPNEYQVKAAFLYNFARFIDWPNELFSSPGDDFSVCVIGEDPFAGTLGPAVAGKSIQNHSIGVRYVDANDLQACHLLFISGSEGYRVRHILAAVENRHVLTVGDEREFARYGSIIAFHIEGKKVRFTINSEAASRAGIGVSSHLLKVAAAVIDSSERGW